MRVSCLEFPDPIEIKEENITIEKIVTAIKCPECGKKAYLKEVDVFVCGCGLVWMVE